MDILKANQSEYDDLQVILKAIHTEIINKDNEIREFMKGLIIEGGGCYVKGVTEKLEYLFDLEGNLSSNVLNDTYKTTEKNLMDFVSTLKEIDKVE